MSLDNDLSTGGISPLVLEEGNVMGQPGGGPLAPTSSFQQLPGKRFRTAASSVANAAGAATISLSGPSVGFAWLVERVTVVGGGTATIYVGSVSDAGFADYSPAATSDVADENSPIYVPGGQPFIVVFAGAGASTVCKITVQALVYKEG